MFYLLKCQLEPGLHTYHSLFIHFYVPLKMYRSPFLFMCLTWSKESATYVWFVLFTSAFRFKPAFFLVCTHIEGKGMCFCIGIIGYHDIVFLNFSFVGIAALCFSWSEVLQCKQYLTLWLLSQGNYWWLACTGNTLQFDSICYLLVKSFDIIN